MKIITTFCANPKCREYFATTNIKKKFCSQFCKNQAAYWHKQKIYQWEVGIQKGRLNNIRILEELMQRRCTNINATELTKMGFNFKIALVPDSDEKQRLVYRFGNLYLVRLSKTEFEIIEVSKVKHK